MAHGNYLRIIFIISMLVALGSCSIYNDVVSNFTAKLIKSRDVIYFGCKTLDILEMSTHLLQYDHFVHAVDFRKNFSLTNVFTRFNYARTVVAVDCSCSESLELFEISSKMLYFNKTYQWLLLDKKNMGVEILLPAELNYPGYNTQLSYVNESKGLYTFWDVHSKGRHLKAPLELNDFATFHAREGLTILKDINDVQGKKYRDQFRGLKLRSATVIDQANITNNAQIERILSNPEKEAGVSAFVKYHFDLMLILRDRLNFTVDYRNSRAWAGKLLNTTYRLGFLGVIQRNEADIGASGAFNRLNRFADFDIMHQSWKLETGFLFRFTPDLNTQGKSGNFLAPFEPEVWIVSAIALCAMNCIWRLIEWFKEMWRWRRQQPQIQVAEEEKVAENSLDESEISWSALCLKTFAAMCQQGMDPIPSGLPTRTVILTVFLFSVIMYNYYTSSVVGGLLSNTAMGPTNVDEIVSSPLVLSFEDIGYHKVMFREWINITATGQRLWILKIAPPRKADEVPVFMRVEESIEFIKRGGIAFHCEVLDAYNYIAKSFDADEICDLRMVSGLIKTELTNWYITKQSQYTELFRVFMCMANEVGLITRTLRLRRPEKPVCQALYRVFPIDLSGVLSAFMLLGGAYVLGFIIMIIEIRIFKMQSIRNEKE